MISETPLHCVTGALCKMSCDPDKRECEGFSEQEYVKLKRQHSLAQTEIKGHMRVKGDLQAELDAHKTVIRLLFESLPECPFMGDLPGYVDALKARIAVLEEELRSLKNAPA